MIVQITDSYSRKVVYEVQVAHRSSACDVIRMWATGYNLRCYEDFLMFATPDYTSVDFGSHRYFGRIIDNSPERLAEVARRLNDPRCKRRRGAEAPHFEHGGAGKAHFEKRKREGGEA